MIVELKGRALRLTESEYFGQGPNPTETYYLIVSRKYLDVNEELQEKEYAIKVFVNGNRNTRNEIAYFIGKLVTMRVTISSKEYTKKDGKKDWMNNLSLSKVEVTENTVKKPEETVAGTQTTIESQFQKPEETVAKTIEEGNQNDADDLPF